MAGPESQIKELELYYEDDGVTTGTLEQGTGQTRHGFWKYHSGGWHGGCGERLQPATRHTFSVWADQLGSKTLGCAHLHESSMTNTV